MLLSTHKKSRVVKMRKILLNVHAKPQDYRFLSWTKGIRDLGLFHDILGFLIKLISNKEADLWKTPRFK